MTRTKPPLLCPLCKSDNCFVVYRATISQNYFKKPYKISSSDYGKNLAIYQCGNCAIIFEDIYGLTKDIAHHYSSLHDTAYEAERENRALAFTRIVEKLQTLKKSGKLLDIGCATGAFLIEAQKAGYTPSGIEPSEWAANIAKKTYNLDIVSGPVENMKFPERSFDVITLLDVIEHLEDPKKVIAGVSKIIKKGGILCIVTPNIESLASRILKEKWWHIRPSHFYYFSPRTLSKVLTNAGFEIEARRDYKWFLSASYLLERLLKLLSIKWYSSPTWMKKITVGINLKDSMEIYAVKT